MNHNKLRADGIPNAILRLSELTSLGLAGNQLVRSSRRGGWRRDTIDTYSSATLPWLGYTGHDSEGRVPAKAAHAEPARQ